MFSDTHAHLYSSKFDGDRDEMIQRAFSAGVNRIFLPAIDSESHQKMFALADRYPEQCFPMMGLHPCSVDPDSIEKEMDEVRDWFSKRDFVAVGETGIDLYWDKTHLKLQQEVFAMQVDMALEKDLPIIIHSRNAFNECFEIVKQKQSAGGGKLRGIFHCWSDGIAQAEKVIALGGFCLGVGGTVTFRNSGVDKVVEAVSMDHIVLETDAPYLAPVPYRGKRNETGYIVDVAKKIAEIKSISLEEVACITTENSRRLFRK